jgi:hypothetical protein
LPLESKLDNYNKESWGVNILLESIEKCWRE